MSIPMVCAGGAAHLQTFAASVVAKATGNAAQLAEGAAVAAGATAVAVGAAAPAGAHTVVVAPVVGANNAGLYDSAKAVFVRSVLPAEAQALPLRDAVDVYPSAGIKATEELAAAKKQFEKTAAVAVQQAKASGAGKVTIMVKDVTKHAQLNAAFEEVMTEVAEGAGVAVEKAGSAQVANQLVMFPENLGVVASADTLAAEAAEQAYAGLLGGVQRTFVLDNEATVVAGNSELGVCNAVAQALRKQGMTQEAKKITDAVNKAKDAKGVLAAL